MFPIGQSSGGSSLPEGESPESTITDLASNLIQAASVHMRDLLSLSREATPEEIEGLKEAAACGDLDRAQHLLPMERRLSAELRADCLLKAVEGGHLAVVSYLLPQTSWWAVSAEAHGSALIKAAKRGDLDVVRYLRPKPATWGRIPQELRSKALIEAAGGHHLNVVQYLLPKSWAATPKCRGEALIVAAKAGYLDVVCFLLPETNKERYLQCEKRPIPESLIADALAEAAESGHFDLVQYLLPAILPGKGLVAAARGGHLKIVQSLFEDQEILSDIQVDALFAAAKGGHLAVVQYLCSIGSPISPELRADAALLAAKGGHIAVLSHLLGGQEMAADWRQLAVQVALENVQVDVLRYLLPEGQDTLISIEDREKYALEAEDRELVEVFLKNGPIGKDTRALLEKQHAEQFVVVEGVSETKDPPEAEQFVVVEIVSETKDPTEAEEFVVL